MTAPAPFAHLVDPPVAVITGANHGIGAATTIALAAAGAHVVASYLRMPPDPDADHADPYQQARARDADGVVDTVRAAGGHAVAVEGDLSDPEMIRRLFDRAEEQAGPVTILVNNASSWVADTFGGHTSDRLGRSIAPVTAASHDRQFAVDARAGALLIAEFARRHLEAGRDWGRIVSLSSGGPLGFPEEVSYGAAKAALDSYTMSAALELADAGVTANVVVPPVTDTGWVTDAVRAVVAGTRELVHVADPAEVAEVIVWLCSPAADLVTANRLVLR